jgi:hypothetical protein
VAYSVHDLEPVMGQREHGADASTAFRSSSTAT